MKIYKTCIKCNVSKEASFLFFHTKLKNPDLLNDTCKECRYYVNQGNNNLFDKENHWKDGKLICLECDNFLDIKQFYKDRKELHRKNRSVYCKDCRKKNSNDPKLVRQRKQYKEQNSIDDILRKRWKTLIGRASKKNFECNVSLEYLKHLWTEQKGMCALSGIPMTTVVGKETKTLTNVSVDRIDPLKGYTIGNVQLVCTIVNIMKSSLTTDELLKFCKLIINKYKEKCLEGISIQ